MDFRGHTELSRGIRNNNPGNIKTGQGWKGVVGNDGTFDIFSDVTWGLRALAMDITAKYNRGLTTISAIISQYAPTSENDTDSYISAVASSTGLGSEELIDLSTDLPDLVRAIIMHENGADGQLVSDADIQQGISMMGNGFTTLALAAGDALVNNTDNSWVWIGGAVLLLAAIYALRKKKR